MHFPVATAKPYNVKATCEMNIAPKALAPLMLLLFLPSCSNDTPKTRWLAMPDYWEQGVEFYVDTESVRKTQDKVIITSIERYDDTFSGQKTLTSAGGPAAVSSSIDYRFDCDAREVEHLHGSMQYADNTKTDFPQQGPSKVVLPNTRIEAVMNYACER